MPDMTVLTEAELRRCVTLDLEAVDIVERAFAALAEGGVVMPPILSMPIAERHGEVDVKTAYVPGLDGFAIKVSPGFFDNPKSGLPSLNGLMVLLDAETGIVKAVLLDNGYLTDVRTAAAGAVAARHLAPRRVRTAGVLGAGVQAELQNPRPAPRARLRGAGGLGPRSRPRPRPTRSGCGRSWAGRSGWCRARRKPCARPSWWSPRPRPLSPWSVPSGCTGVCTSPLWARTPTTRASWSHRSWPAPTASSATVAASPPPWARCVPRWPQGCSIRHVPTNWARSAPA